MLEIQVERAGRSVNQCYIDITTSILFADGTIWRPLLLVVASKRGEKAAKEGIKMHCVRL